jgi:sucrose phosphorylase
VAARAIQLFAKGVPQIYYVGLLAGTNDKAAADHTGDGRAINRHDYRLEEVEEALRRPAVGRIIDLIRLRNRHRAFDGQLCTRTIGDGAIRLEWRTSDADLALEVDFVAGSAALVEGNRVTTIAQWAA